MSRLEDMLRKTRAVLIGRGIALDDAEDLVHDAFIRVDGYEKTHIVLSRQAVMIKTALNISIDRQRHERRAPFASSTATMEIADAQPRPDEVALARTRLRRASEGLAQLNEKTRRILLNRRLDDLSVAQIAEREGMTVAAVEKQIARATLNLMKWMDGW